MVCLGVEISCCWVQTRGLLPEAEDESTRGGGWCTAESAAMVGESKADSAWIANYAGSGFSTFLIANNAGSGFPTFLAGYS